MDKTALFSLSYGVYIVATLDGTRPVGCVANSVIQVSASPATVAISLNKDNFTTPCALKTGGLTVSILSEQASGSLIGAFGFHSSRDKDKFADTAHDTVDGNLPIVTDGVCAWLSCKVVGTLDAGTHTILLAEVSDAGRLNDAPPMTYDYYHKVIKGKAPKNAPTYVEKEPASAQYICTICGYVYPGSAEEFEALPDDWKCPLCFAPKAMFERK